MNKSTNKYISDPYYILLLIYKREIAIPILQTFFHVLYFKGVFGMKKDIFIFFFFNNI